MSHISTIIIPTIITLIVLVGLIEKKEVYNIFCDGVTDGILTIKSMFPTLIAVFLAISLLKNSGIINFFTEKISIITANIRIPNEIIPLMIIKPISGSASLAIATDLMKEYGVDNRIGLLAGTIMSSSETTFYVIAMYLSTVKVKGSSRVIIPALIADIAMMITSIMIIK